MSGTLEQKLRSFYSQSALELPMRSVANVHARSYPRSHFGSRTTLRVGLSVPLLAVAAVGALLASGGSPRTASFVRWSATPTPAPSGQVASAQTSCSSVVSSVSGHFATGPGANSVFAPSTAGWDQLLADTRGPYTLVAFDATVGSETEAAACLTGGPQFASRPQVAIRSLGASASEPAPGAVSGPATEWNATSNVTVAVGQIGAGVTGVTLVLANGSDVVATVGNGYYAAWWPGNANVQSGSVATASGTTSQVFPGAQPVPGAGAPASGSQGE